MPSIYIVDDDAAIRDALSFQLEAAGHRVRTFISGVEFLREAPLLELGCLILDVRMPEMDGPTLQQRLRELKLNFPVVMITGHGDLPLAVRAMKAGAVDFIEKPFAEETLLDSVRSAHERIAAIGEDQAYKAHAAAARLATLSPREREVLERLVSGLPNKVVAYELNISQRTVEVHRANIMDKTLARSLAELVRIALAAGIAIKDDRL